MTPQPLPSAPDDGIGLGVGVAVMCQFAFIMAGAVTMFLFPLGIILFGGWGLLQWLVLLPIYFRQRNKGRPLAGKGILVTGCIGFLLNAACDGIISTMTYYPAS
jgi:hypothetical protein